MIGKNDKNVLGIALAAKKAAEAHLQSFGRALRKPGKGSLKARQRAWDEGGKGTRPTI